MKCFAAFLQRGQRFDLGLVMLFTFAGLAVTGCGQKESVAPQGDQTGQETEDEAAEDEDVGVEDFVDYATGKLPIEKGRRIEKQIRDIQAERNRQIEDALEEE